MASATLAALSSVTAGRITANSSPASGALRKSGYMVDALGKLGDIDKGT